jgi:hypothetical protein
LQKVKNNLHKNLNHQFIPKYLPFMPGSPKCSLSIHNEQEFYQALGKFRPVSAASGKTIPCPSEPTDGFLFSQPQIALREGDKHRVME